MVVQKDSYFKAHDHHRLYFESYRTESPRAVLILIHGLNEHIGRYAHVVDYLKDQYNIYLFDHRGHGRSDGVRSHVEDFDHYIQDINEFVQIVLAKEKNKKIFLIGHSMGGQLVVNYLARYPQDSIVGFVTSSANLKLMLKVSPFKRFIGEKLLQVAPKLKLPNEIDPKWICRDKAVVLAYKKDPLIGKSISVQLASEILSNLESVMQLASKIKIPALMMHGGDDQISDKEGTVEFFEKLASKDKEMKIFEGMYHEIFNEIEREKVLAEMGSWLKRRT